MGEIGKYIAIVTNDDGIGAPGLEVLAASLAASYRLVTVAPATACSGCGHSLTTHGPIRVEPRGADAFAVYGTPGDCVRLALLHLAPRADLVVSGINAGGNLGCDLFHSGTAAGAREAALRGRRAVAFSQYLMRERPVDWLRAGWWAARVLSGLIHTPLPPRSFWNVNFPCLLPDDPEPAIVECPVDYSELPMGYRTDGENWTYCGSYRDRARVRGGDIDVCFGGAISVSRVDAV